MNQSEVLDVLKSLVEGKLEPDDWIKWWNKNGKAASKLVDAKEAARFKANPKSPYESAHNCQNVAEIILKKAGIRTKRSMRYVEIYMKQADAEEKEKSQQLKPRIDLLKEKFPNLHKCLYRNNKKIEAFEPGASAAEIAKIEKSLKLRLPPPIQEFFKITKRFDVEGFQLDLDLLFEHPGDKSAPDGKRYLCLGNYFLEDDGDQILIDVSTPSSDPQILYYAHSGKSPKIRAVAKNWNEFLERLPKKYLNSMFYYS